jgi:cytochrome b561
MALALLHIAAALKHQFIDKDNLVSRMLPKRH